MNPILKILIGLVFLEAISLRAELTVTVLPPKVSGQKAVVELKMKNDLAEKVESARAICFLLDEHGQMVGQASRWVIGGKKDHPALEPKKETVFNFVIASSHGFASTNLVAKVDFSRVVLEGEKLADPKRDVQIMPLPQK